MSTNLTTTLSELPVRMDSAAEAPVENHLDLPVAYENASLTLDLSAFILNSQELVYVDTCALVDLATVMLYRLGFARIAVILRSVSQEISNLSAHPDKLRQCAGQDAARTVALLHSLPRVRMIMDDAEPSATYADPDLVKHALEHGGYILTADRGLLQEARDNAIGILDLNAFRNELRVLNHHLNILYPPFKPYKPGDTVTVSIDRLGRKDKQGVGYLADGRQVVVADAENHLGEEVEAQVDKVHNTPSGTEMLFASDPRPILTI